VVEDAQAPEQIFVELPAQAQVKAVRVGGAEQVALVEARVVVAQRKEQVVGDGIGAFGAKGGLAPTGTAPQTRAQ